MGSRDVREVDFDFWRWVFVEFLQRRKKKKQKTKKGRRVSTKPVEQHPETKINILWIRQSLHNFLCLFRQSFLIHIPTTDRFRKNPFLMLFDCVVFLFIGCWIVGGVC